MQFLDKLRPILIQNYLDLTKKWSEVGFTLLRFSDRDIFKNIDGVLQEIFDRL
jgi:very-short-patch-repair endonuclease